MLALAVGLLVAAVVGVTSVLGREEGLPLPSPERCVATAGDSSVVLDLEQGHYASIIAGLSVRRGLAPRAASIALATAYQESDIRNLDYGDRDSVGLFQQRPSQGWGTAEDLQDPHFATNAFYDALLRVPGWESGDITEVAQRVQRSGYPDAYRDHESDARVLASVLTGRSRPGFTCLDRSQSAGDPAGLVTAVRETFGQTTARTEEKVVTLVAGTTAEAWAYAHFAVANASRHGAVAVRIGRREWRASATDLPSWTRGALSVRRLRVEVTFR